MLSIAGGSKYLKIITDHYDSKSAYCFIDLTNGNLLRPASWKAPAKHASGNLFDDDYAVSYAGPFGIAYMSTNGKVPKTLWKRQ